MKVINTQVSRGGKRMGEQGGKKPWNKKIFALDGKLVE
jgi:hypothetical protein